MRFRHGYVHQYQATAFRFLLIICIVAISAFVLVNIYQGLLLLASFQAVFVGFSLIVLFLLLKDQFGGALNKICHTYLSLLYGLLFLGLLFAPHVDTTIFSSIFLIPPASYLLLGQYWGGFYSTFFSLTLLFLYFSRFAAETEMFSIGVLGNLVVCLATVWLFSYLYEKSKKQSQELLIKTASEDRLTQLLNRASLDVILDRDSQASIERNTPLSIVIIDIDWFQIINDNYGHKLGDEVLVEVAQILKTSVRHCDSVFRIAGQEFCLSLPYTTPKEAYRIAENIRIKIEKKAFQFDKTVISLTISAGIVSCDNKKCVLETLLKDAYKCMYQAKKEGRNQIIISNESLT